jgi:glycosyltransferase involved in cell wall biosynthesis
VIVSFVWPSTHHYAGGVRVLWELANGLANRGHEVHFIHGPEWPMRITDIDQLPPFPWDPRVQHHIVDALDDAALPKGDIVFHPSAPPRLGLPVVMVQGFRMMYRRWERDSFRARAPKVCVARWLMDVARGFGVPDEQLWHVPLGMDHEIFSVRTPLSSRPYDVSVLFNVHVSKGWQVGLDTLHDLCRRRPDVKAAVFGIYGPPDDLPPNVDLKVGLDQERLAEEVYNATKVFLQTSYHEGFGYTAVEAMACGAALVTTDNGGSQDYAVPGETALLAAPGDVEGLAAGVEVLLNDEAQRIRLATAGEQYVRRFDWDLSAERLEHYLERYLADPEAYQREPADVTTTGEAS